MIIQTKDGQKHEILLPQGEHLLEYVRNARRAMEKEELFDAAIDALERFVQAEKGHGWSELKEDCAERIAYDNARYVLDKARALDDHGKAATS